MRESSPATRKDDFARDVGTTWTMTRNDSTARCALLSRSQDWELRLFINGEPLLSTRRSAIQDLLETAREWRDRLAERGWIQVTPSFPGSTLPLADADALV